MTERTEKSKVTVWVGGAAGDGCAAMGESFARLCARSGLHVFAYNSYQSVIRGGHVYYQVRVGPGHEKVLSQGDFTDILIALNQDAMDRHARHILPGGGAIFNSDKVHPPTEGLPKGTQAWPLPVKELIGDYAKQPVVQNTVCFGALVFLLEFPWENAEEVLRDLFGGRKKGAEIVETNVKYMRAGYEHARKNWKPLGLGLRLEKKRRPLLTGNQAFALGAAAAGCKFYAAYPMTPASSILHWMAAHGPKLGIMVRQPEDEIAVVNMAIGAAFSGVRAMCATSGGGFSLMTEAIGQAGMTETPIVVINSQRGGPSTGLPTKTEQADLFQMIGASQGDFPKIVLAPGTVEEAFYLIQEAFNLAERWQCPVIVASDLYLSEHMETVDGLDFNRIPIDRGMLVDPDRPEPFLVTADNSDDRTLVHPLAPGAKEFLRYQITPTGVSPRALPGSPGLEHIAATDEHDERGDLISDVATDEKKRRRMMDKRMKKWVLAAKEFPPPQWWGPEGADLTILGWGSTATVIRDAVRVLNKLGQKVNHLHFSYLWPFPAEQAMGELKKCRRTLCVENNWTGQFERLLRMETGFVCDDHLREYGGEPFGPGQIIRKAQEVLEGAAV